VKAVARQEGWQSRFAYSAPLWVAAVLLVSPSLPGFLSERLLPDDASIVRIGVLLTAAGLGFAIWARVHLGGNWSAEVTVKHDHELIGSGPYALARHPIYTGLLLAFVGTAIVVGEWRAGSSRRSLAAAHSGTSSGWRSASWSRHSGRGMRNTGAG
jgi:protein-S-isoprenylcysteine O-methyltransferase Ste14